VPELQEQLQLRCQNQAKSFIKNSSSYYPSSSLGMHDVLICTYNM
jgi:hypothetical protein